MIAVLKADAYGHGAAQCATFLEGTADGFGVAFVDEALALRAAGVQAPILVLEGAFSAGELLRCQSHDLWIVVHHEEQLRMLEASKLPERSLSVWLKVDSGMHRAGFIGSAVRDAYERLARCSSVADIVLMTHFACADDPASDMTVRQMREFNLATVGLPGDRSLCNSAGILGWPQARLDWGRCGIALYGADPMPEASADLEPVMRLTSEIFAVKVVQPGDSIGYGASFVAGRPTRVGLVAMGYADGYPRAAPTGTPVLVGSTRSWIVGRVSMDMITVDLTEVPDSGIGSVVEFWGKSISVVAVAQRAGTIAYELLCNVKRVEKAYSAAEARS